MKSTRFCVAVHTLVALAVKGGEFVSSEAIAWSVDTNASLIRRLMSSLQRAGMITSQSGVKGGAKLAMKPEDITLLDVYCAVEDKTRMGVHSTNPKCPFGDLVEDQMKVILAKGHTEFERVLASKTIAQVAKPAIRRVKRAARS